jgi:molecular chaperone IbpA
MNNLQVGRAFPLIPTNNLFDIFDILFKDALDTSSVFSPIQEAKFHYPVDIKTTDEGVQFEFAIVGVDKKDVQIEVEDEKLMVIYNNKASPPEDLARYIHKGITKKSFNFTWKLGGKFDSSNIDATMDKGLLTIKIPYNKTSAKKLIGIK